MGSETEVWPWLHGPPSRLDKALVKHPCWLPNLVLKDVNDRSQGVTQTFPNLAAISKCAKHFMTICAGDLNLLWLNVDVVCSAFQSCGSLGGRENCHPLFRDDFARGVKGLLVSGDKIMPCRCTLLCISLYTTSHFYLPTPLLESEGLTLFSTNQEYCSKRGFILNKNRDIACFVHVVSPIPRTALGT